MKKTLTVLCLAVLAGAAAGQYPMYNRLPLDTATIAPKCDTIPIIYLYSDTAQIEIGFGKTWVGNGAYWDFGYEVISDGDLLGYTVEPMTILKPVYERKSIGYLDRGKQPLKKTIIIWQVRETEPK